MGGEPTFFVEAGMGDPDLAARIRQLAEPVIQALGAQLVVLRVHPRSGSLVVELLVDEPGGITLGTCRELNVLIGNQLDASAIIPGPYVLEVSSPGLDRPLVDHQDFQRVVGERVQVLRRGAGGVVQVVGRLVRVEDDRLVLALDGAGPELAIPRAEIVTATREIPFGTRRAARAAPKRGR